MIEFKEHNNTIILPEGEVNDVPKKEQVKMFFDAFFKDKIEQYLVYKKNQFKNPNRDILDDFLLKFDDFVKNENKEESNKQTVNLIFQNLKCSFDLLKECKVLPDNDRMVAFFIAFMVSKIFS
jgi:hypothetical protein